MSNTILKSSDNHIALFLLSSSSFFEIDSNYEMNSFHNGSHGLMICDFKTSLTTWTASDRWPIENLDMIGFGGREIFLFFVIIVL